MHDNRFPNENPTYRQARNRLLEAEIELRRNVERVAAQRRDLLAGGEVPEDYAFMEGSVETGETREVRLSELFSPNRDTLILYSFMYGPSMERPCASCTSILDALDGTAPHVRERVDFAVVARSPIERILAFARDRGWRNHRLLSSAWNAYNIDYYGESRDGDQWPSLNVFVRREDRIHHFWHSELLFTRKDAGQGPRHVDMIWPLWNLFDLTPGGRGANWEPRLEYTAAEVGGGEP
ncbi:MAG TPA: DUF899 family protein [Gemmatimonadota bacterium]|nr:DUF899 family protein [Gemmatimonadota bacterium]